MDKMQNVFKPIEISYYATPYGGISRFPSSKNNLERMRRELENVAEQNKVVSSMMQNIGPSGTRALNPEAYLQKTKQYVDKVLRVMENAATPHTHVFDFGGISRRPDFGEYRKRIYEAQSEDEIKETLSKLLFAQGKPTQRSWWERVMLNTFGPEGVSRAGDFGVRLSTFKGDPTNWYIGLTPQHLSPVVDRESGRTAYDILSDLGLFNDI